MTMILWKGDAETPCFFCKALPVKTYEPDRITCPTKDCKNSLRRWASYRGWTCTQRALKRWRAKRNPD